MPLPIPRRACLRIAALAGAAAFGLSAPAQAQASAPAFPQAGKPIRLIVTFPAGGQTDIQARALAPKLQASLGVPVIVDNKPGASTCIGSQDLVRVAPDGHTLLLYGEMMKEAAGIDMVHIPFKGSGDAGTALIGNQVQLLFNGPTTAIAMAKGGRLKTLGVTDMARYGAVPEVPTMAENGVPGLDLDGGMMFYAPAKTPREVILRINDELAKALRDPAVKDLHVNGGTEIVASSPEALGELNRRGSERRSAIIEKLGIQLV